MLNSKSTQDKLNELIQILCKRVARNEEDLAMHQSKLQQAEELRNLPELTNSQSDALIAMLKPAVDDTCVESAMRLLLKNRRQLDALQTLNKSSASAELKQFFLENRSA